MGWASPKRTLFRVRLARSCSRVWKLWTGCPSSVRLSMALRRAAGETLALATGEGALSGGGFEIVVLEQHRGEVALHVPDDVVGEHAQEDVGADAVGPAMVDRTDVEVAGFDVAKAAFGVAEALVGEDEVGGCEAVRGKRAPDHVDTVERGLRGDRLGSARPCEAGLGDGEVEMLGHAATVDALRRP